MSIKLNWDFFFSLALNVHIIIMCLANFTDEQILWQKFSANPLKIRYSEEEKTQEYKWLNNNKIVIKKKVKITQIDYYHYHVSKLFMIGIWCKYYKKQEKIC